MNDLMALLQGMRINDVVYTCCVCKKRLKVHRAWIDITPKDYALLSTNNRISHGYCPECFKRIMDKLKGFKKTKGECNDCGQCQKSSWED